MGQLVRRYDAELKQDVNEAELVRFEAGAYNRPLYRLTCSSTEVLTWLHQRVVTFLLS
jgi:hypothetical protein